MAIFTKKELERFSAGQLSALCVKVSESQSASSVDADQARDLINDWKKLTNTSTPPRPSAKEQQDIQAEMGKLHLRMVAFLNALGLTK